MVPPQDPLIEEELEEAPPRRVRSESISSMSQLLLQGWAMLAESCPDCGCPLMRHPGGQQLLCVNCGSDSATAEPAGNAPAPPATAAAASQDDSASAGASRLQRLPNGTADGHASSSEDEGEVELLQPPPPLAARLRQAAAATAVQPAPQLGGRARAAGAAAGSNRQRQGEEDASKRVAELMLEGWAMLQDHCPRCMNPLLRSRDRRIYCAGCQMYALREGEAPPREELPAAPLQRSGVADSEPAAAARVPPSAVMAQTAQAGQRAATAAVAAWAAAEAGPALASMRQHLTTLKAAAEAVAEQLAGATAALREAAGAGQAAPLLAHVQQCAAALQALSDCGRSLAALQ